MRTARLGRTDVLVTPIGFGAAPIGNLYTAVDDDAAAQALDSAWAAGIRYFDTAPHYGLGLSERRLGEALRNRPRAEFTVSTKVGRLLVPNPRPRGSDLSNGFDVADASTRQADYSADGVLRSLEQSLARLHLDRVDIVYVHDPDDHLDDAIRHSLPALARLRDEGMIGAIGAGMNSVAPLQRIVHEADVDVVMVAGRWSLVDRSAAPLLAQCESAGVAVVVAAPFNSGLLATTHPHPDAHFDYQPAPTSMIERAQSVHALCERHGVRLPHAALQFPLRHPAVAAVVAGMRTAAEVTADAAWADQRISDPFWTALNSMTV
ncbi:MAG: aldo/keto reductase [Jatrophihabitans sp.]|uniref:aldo/keto reductase n=1 Tax=Jatrophihabitans sp. TaxID=1932789 RepID=UPI003F7FC6D0